MKIEHDVNPIKLSGTEPQEKSVRAEQSAENNSGNKKVSFFAGNLNFGQSRVDKERQKAKEAVSAAREKCEKVVLATNPIFPMVGQESRLSWVDLSKNDFDYITSYESESFGKPNPRYFSEVCKKMGFLPEECLMIGNDVKEDMLAAKAAGMDSYLVTDYQILDSETIWEGKQGTFAEMIEMLRSLP